MEVKNKGYIIESLAEPYGAGWQCSLIVWRRLKSGEQADVRRETLKGPYDSPMQAEKAGLERGRDIVDGLPKLPDDRLYPPLEKG